MTNGGSMPVVITITKQVEKCGVSFNLYKVLAVVAIVGVILFLVGRKPKEEVLDNVPNADETTTVLEDAIPLQATPTTIDERVILYTLTNTTIDEDFVSGYYEEYYSEQYESKRSFVQYLINLTYANRHHAFKDSEVQEVFNQKEWYVNGGKSVEWTDFTKTEQHNLTVLTRMRKNLK